MTRRAALAFLLATGGCTLIDQRTFNPDAGRAPAVAQPPAAPSAPPVPPTGAPPLVTIPLAPAVEYEQPLHDAVALALRRGRRDFEVRMSVPDGAPDAQATATKAATRIAARVADLINRQGGRTVLTAQADAARTASVVLVFVR